MAEKPNPIGEGTAAPNTVEDAELDDLLSDALNDFGKPPPERKKDAEESKPNEEQVKTTNLPAGDDLNKLLGGQFEKDLFSALTTNLQDEMQQMQQMLAQGLEPSEAEELSANFRKVAEETAKVFSEQKDSDFSSTINQALKSLSEGTENLQNAFADENVMKMFSNMPTDISDDFLPVIEQMMHSLLSKDILYPALKDLLDKYDSWLQQNQNRLEVTDYNRYRKQESHIKEVCEVLESETESDSPEVKKRRFDSLITLMHQVQDCGQPPKELMDSIKPFEELPLQSEASPCSIM